MGTEVTDVAEPPLVWPSTLRRPAEGVPDRLSGPEPLDFAREGGRWSRLRRSPRIGAGFGTR
jgi:hypothetical protein